MIQTAGLVKSYNGEPCLRGVSLSVARGEFVSLMGESGSGKTTLLEILVGVRTPDAGEILVAGENIRTLSDKGLSLLRRTKLGVVYQSFGLIPMLTAEENILLPLLLRREGTRDKKEQIAALAERLGILGCLSRRPSELSGGQAQRVAIARALIYRPELVLLDEPTGSLDRENTERVLRFLRDYREETGTTVLQITHDRRAAETGDRILRLRDGVIEG